MSAEDTATRHEATVAWRRTTASFAYEDYSRDHTATIGPVAVPMSAAPSFYGNERRVDPEAALVAATASCHMLTFLAVCAKKRIVVDAYDDAAVGILDKNANGRLAVTRIELHPRVTFAPGHEQAPEALAKLHETAHRGCIIANSIRSQVEWTV